MDSKDHEQLDSARNAAVHFLSFRLRSISETRSFLQGKHIPLPIIDNVLNHLEETGLLDDRKFAAWVSDSRARTGYGPVRIRQELQQKGVAADTIEEVLKKDWTEIVKPLIKKLQSKTNSGDERKRKLKLQQYLLRHGFTYNHIARAFESKD